MTASILKQDPNTKRSKRMLIYFNTDIQYTNFQGNPLYQVTKWHLTDKRSKMMKNEKKKDLPCFGVCVKINKRSFEPFCGLILFLSEYQLFFPRGDRTHSWLLLWCVCCQHTDKHAHAHSVFTGEDGAGRSGTKGWKQFWKSWVFKGLSKQCLRRGFTLSIRKVWG